MADHKDTDPKGKAAGETPAAAPPAVEFEASPQLEEYVTKEHRLNALTCPQCGGATEPYSGPNPHKQGSTECPRCRLRLHPA